MKKLICLLLLLCMAVPALADERGQDVAVRRSVAYVITDTPGARLNLREGPGTKYASQGKYYAGVEVELTGERQNGFAKVCIGVAEGWMQESFLSAGMQETEIPSCKVSNKNGTGANLRSKPSKERGRVLALYQNGTAVQVLAVLENDWLHVKVEGRDGYMMGSLLNIRLSYRDKEKQEYLEPGSMYISTGHKDTFAPVYAQPDTNSQLVAEELSRDMVIVQEYATGGWAKIWNGPLTGWVQTQFLADLDDKVVNGLRSSAMLSGNKAGTVAVYSASNRNEVVAWVDANELFHIRAVLPDGWVYGWMDRIPQGCFVRTEQLADSLYPTTRMDTLYVSVSSSSVRLHLRSEPDAESASLARFWNGTPVSVVEYDAKRQWARVVVGDLDGWMSTSYLTSDPSKVNTAWYYGVTKARTVMYAAPRSKGFWSPATLASGTQVRLLGFTEDDWAYVSWQDTTGWVPKADLQVGKDVSW